MSDGGSVWALGNYPRIAREVLAGLGPELVTAAGVGPGQRVLDVAAGSGLTAIPAAAAGASVVAADLTPELLSAGRAEAAARGVEIEWVEADAQALPFADADFDVVMSSIGAMFAPDHQRAADEMLRVCRPGGAIVMANWTPDGSIGEFFRLLASYSPPPPPATDSPVAWGTEEHVRELFGDQVHSLWTEERSLPVRRFADPTAYCAYYKTHFGPVIATYAGIGGEPDRVAALDRDFHAYAERCNRARPGEQTCYEYEYLLVLARVGGTLPPPRGQ